MHVKIAEAIMGMDPMLAAILTVEDISNAAAGMKPKHGRSGSVSMSIEIE